jgi:hypothetical protein
MYVIKMSVAKFKDSGLLINTFLEHTPRHLRHVFFYCFILHNLAIMKLGILSEMEKERVKIHTE